MTIETETFAAELLQELAAKGINMMISPERPNRLRYSPKAAMTGELIARLKLYKANLLVLLQESGEQQVGSPCDDLPADVNDWPEDWRYRYDERAGIMEFDGDLTRQQAETRAETITRAVYRAHERTQENAMPPREDDGF